jgi:uncharacterized protein YhhL (DUF1145 family)
MHKIQIKVFKNSVNKKGNIPKKKKLVILTIFPVNALII